MGNVFAIPTELQNLSEIHKLNVIVAEGIGPRDIIEVILPPLSHEQREALKLFLKCIEVHCTQNFLTELLTFADMELVLITEVWDGLLLSFGAKVGLVGNA